MNRYEIRVTGHLGARRAQALGAESWRVLPDGESARVFALVDQAATYGLLARMRDAGLELVSVVRLDAECDRGSLTASGLGVRHGKPE